MKLERFKTFENNNALYSGPPLINKVNTIASTTVGSGSDGLIGGQNNPGDLGGEFPKKYSPSTAKPPGFKQTIDKIKQKESRKRKKGIDRVKKINMLNFKDFNKKKKKKKKKDD